MPLSCISWAAPEVSQHSFSLNSILPLACQTAWKHHQHSPFAADLHIGGHVCTQGLIISADTNLVGYPNI